MNLVSIAYTMTCYNGGTIEDLTNIHVFQCSQRIFYLFEHRALPLSCLFFTGREIITFRRGRVAPDTISPLMTLKSWSREDATRDGEIDLEVEENRLLK